LQEAEQSLLRVSSYLQSSSPHYASGWAHGTPGALLIPRPVAMQLSKLGWETKHKVKEFLYGHSKLTQAFVEESGLKQWIEAAPHPETLASLAIDPWPITRTPEQIIIIVAGGAHPTHNYWMQAMSPSVISREIALPARWDSLVSDADIEIGPGGDMCIIE
jgi:hypothetical protein